MKRSKFTTVRNLAVATILVMVGWLVARTWIARSAVIVSESMAPALAGPHLEAACPVCGQLIKVAVEDDYQECLDSGHPIACGNCGELIRLPADTPVTPGGSLLVRRDTSFQKPSARWDLVACRDPESPERIIAKRVVGLPGESVRIVEGDVFVDGKIARKSFDQQAAVAVPVYMADHETVVDSAKLPRRWRPSSAESGWSAEQGAFHFAAAHGKGTNAKGNAEKKGSDRLVYHHLRRSNNRMIPGPVVDEFAYNQWLPIRRDSYRPVSDLMLTFHITQLAGKGRLKVFTADDRYAVTFDYGTKKVAVQSLEGDRPKSLSEKRDRHLEEEGAGPGSRIDSKLLAEGNFQPPANQTALPVLLSTVDRALMVVVAREVVLNVPLPESVPSGPTPFSFEAVDLEVDLRRVRIYRDVYYVRPVGIEARWAFDEPVLLKEGEYFLLGDNSRVSEDSRTWPHGPAVRRAEIFGQIWKFSR